MHKPNALFCYYLSSTARRFLLLPLLTEYKGDQINGKEKDYSYFWRMLFGIRSVPIIGKICMDQLMIDVTQVEGVQRNDTVTLMGKDRSEKIRCEEIADKCGTITNEVLTGLGSRLAYLTTPE